MAKCIHFFICRLLVEQYHALFIFHRIQEYSYGIGTEKLVSGEYNTDVFAFANTALRKLLADIQIEEQNHAEMIYKYKTANGMA